MQELKSTYYLKLQESFSNECCKTKKWTVIFMRKSSLVIRPIFKQMGLSTSYNESLFSMGYRMAECLGFTFFENKNRNAVTVNSKHYWNMIMNEVYLASLKWYGSGRHMVWAERCNESYYVKQLFIGKKLPTLILHNSNQHWPPRFCYLIHIPQLHSLRILDNSSSRVETWHAIICEDH